MKLLETYFNTLINLINVIKEEKRIVVIKGVPIALIERLKEDFLFTPPLNRGYIDVNIIKLNTKELIKEVVFSKNSGLLLYEQLFFIAELVTPNLFSNEVVVIEDNLRALFPNHCIPEFLDLSDGEFEIRSDDMPGFYAETIDLEGHLFFKYSSTPLEFESVCLFRESLVLEETIETGHSVVDLELDSNAIDLFLSDRLNDSHNVPIIYVKKSDKNQHFKLHIKKLEQINFVLNQIGSKLVLQHTDPLKHTHSVSEDVYSLLYRYWGESSLFRDLKVYQNPDTSKEIIEISQGDVVQCVVNEFNNAIQNKIFKDIFLTAPTGAGKSLLFQLPAFYISERGGMSIVVSPLIALMKDQVSAIIRDRNYHKVAYVNSELNFIDREKTIESCKSGEIDILYLSPELLLSYDISYFVGSRNLGLLIIDEAHLVTTWGRDFRVDYWFLGTHLRKIRKYSGHKFPIIAVTATAVYGGSNDMVFDCIDSLYLMDPHIFIGNIVREDIKFLIGREAVRETGYEKHKFNQTLDFINKIASESLFKTVIYAPYSRQVRQLYEELSDEVKNITAQYYGTLDKDSKSNSYDGFLTNEKRLMLCTKAFGMGIDISDIVVAYHHAPSGQLADYVQEIGRIARDKELTGYAVINFSEKDLWFSKLLHGMSAIKPWELRDVLKKLNKLYLREKTQNLLISVDDFAHIFHNPFDLDQKVMTTLMMIEKDYLIKYRFNVIIARPKKLFTKVFGRMTRYSFKKFKDIYKDDSIRLLEEISTSDNVVVEINLDTIWKNGFKNMSFPVLKAKYFKNELFQEYDIIVVPQLKISYVIEEKYADAITKFDDYLTIIQTVFSRMEGFFTENELYDEIVRFNIDKTHASKLTKHIISIYSSFHIGFTKLQDPNSFLQKRKSGEDFSYRVFGTKFASEFAALKRLFDTLFNLDGLEKDKVTRYITKDSSKGILMVRLGYLLELCDIGSFEVSGGESPMIFLRINDPKKLAYDASQEHGSNYLLEDVHRRHKLSNEIFSHFFLREFSDINRWRFIEDYFLGKEIDDLLDEYPGEEKNNDKTNVFETLTSIVGNENTITHRLNAKIVPLLKFPPNPDQVYWGDNLLTINVNGKDETKRINSWLKREAVLLDKICCEYHLKFAKPVYTILMSKIKTDKEYYATKMGFGCKIKLHDDGPELPAKSHFEMNPRKFYEWWCRNKEKLSLSTKDLIIIFLRIYDLEHSVLLSEHKKFLQKRGLI